MQKTSNSYDDLKQQNTLLQKQKITPQDFSAKQVREITIEFPQRGNFANLPKGDPLESPPKFLQDLGKKKSSLSHSFFTVSEFLSKLSVHRKQI